MKIHTQEFKNKIKEFGKELDNKVTYELNNETIELGNEELNSITPHYEGAILKSVMKQLDVDSNVDIPIGTEVNYQLGLKLRSGKNLFNKSTKVVGYLNTTNGSVYSDNLNWNTSDFILVDANKNYTFSWTSSSNFFQVNVCYYNNSKTFISGTIFEQANIYEKTFTTPQNTKYIKVSYSLKVSGNPVSRENIQVELGSQATSYEEYGACDYLDYGNYIVKESEKQEDTNSYRLTCYDKMLYAMKDYEALTDANDEYITYPITIRDYLIALARRLNLTFKNANDIFVNYDKQIKSERYLTEDGASLNYTYRDVLDELSQATASSICISDDDELEIRYVNQTIGKNISWMTLEEETTKGGITYTPNDDDSITIEGTRTSVEDFAPISLYLKPNTNYWFVCIDKETGELISSNSSKIQAQFSGSVGIGEMDFNRETPYTTNNNVNPNYLYHFYFKGMNNGTIVRTGTYWFMVVESYDNVSSPYEPYGDTIDEEYLKDVNVKFDKEKFGPVNAVVLSRSESDSINRTDDESIQENGLCEIKISENQILNDDDRDLFIDEIFNQLKGLEYCVNDYNSTGVCYYDFLDKYNVKIGNNFYPCLMLNDEVDVEQGLSEIIHSESIEQFVTDYTKSSKTDKTERRTELIVDKQNGEISSIVGKTTELEGNYDTLNTTVASLGTRVTQNEENISFAVTKEQLDTTLNAGVPKVVTTLVTIDENGIDVGTTASKVHTTMANNEFRVGSKDSDSPLAFIGYYVDPITQRGESKAEMDNLRVNKWLNAGAHRIEKFEFNSEERTGFFYDS